MLDGGAMFGVVPKSLWSRHMTADANNLCSWAMRCLLVENEDNLLLVDRGIVSKLSDLFFSKLHLQGVDSLDRSLAARGFSRADITDVLLTHLHFDHVGGAVERDANALLKPAIPKAQYRTCERHWDWAMNPNPREKASFLSENLLPLEESGQLCFIDRDGRWNREPFGERFPDWTSSLPMATPKAKCFPLSRTEEPGWLTWQTSPLLLHTFPWPGSSGTTPALCSPWRKRPCCWIRPTGKIGCCFLSTTPRTPAAAWRTPRKEFEPPASLPALKKLGADPVQRAINPLLIRLTSAGPS